MLNSNSVSLTHIYFCLFVDTTLVTTGTVILIVYKNSGARLTVSEFIYNDDYTIMIIYL